MAAGTFALGAPLSAAAPVPGTLETYRDWTIGCDNRGRCEAVSLLPENGDWADEPFVFGIARDAGPDADVEIFTAQDEKYARASLTFRVDGRKVASLVARGDEAKVQGPQATALALAMARGSVMEVRVNDTVIARPSLAGSAAALRYIDAKQGRAGTVTALVASGPIGRNAVRPAPPAPIIRRAIVPPGPASAPLWREELATLGRITGCAAEMKDAATGPDLQRLSKGATLILTPCGAGAYNFLSVAVIATGVPGRRAFRLAAFDRKPAWADDIKVPVLVNSMWSPDTSRLDHYAKGRGLGDCGDNQSYVWDGATFRLVEARSMGECRGSWHWIKTWSAQVAG